MSKGLQYQKDLYLTLPYITRGSAPEGFFETCSQWLENGMKGFLVRNLESYGMLRHLGWQKYCVLDTSIYTWNNESVSFWKKEGILRNTVPYELNEKEIAHLSKMGSLFAQMRVCRSIICTEPFHR